MKKITSILLILAMLLVSVPSFAFEEVSGFAGDVNWSINPDGKLRIYGNGAIPDYSPMMDMPWYPFMDNVTSIVIEEGITNIGTLAFCGYQHSVNIDSVSFPKTLKGIGESTFTNIDSIDTVYYNAESCDFTGENPNYANEYFPRAKKLVVGKDVKHIGANVFRRAEGYTDTDNTYKEVVYEGTEEEWNKIDIDYTGNNILRMVSFSNASDEKHINVLINNSLLYMPQPPVIVDGRTLVPLRAIFEALGAEVTWDPAEQRVDATKAEISVSMQINNNIMTVNNSDRALDVPARIINDSTMIPVRAVAEAFDCSVGWNGIRDCVIIVPNNQQPYTIEATVNGSLAATAYFDQRGLLCKIEGEKEWFMPLWVNINSNVYLDTGMDRSWPKGDIEFSYNDDGTVKDIKLLDSGNSCRSYYYEYENGCCVFHGRQYDNTSLGEYLTYIGQKCTIGFGLSLSSGDDIEPNSYTFDNNGLLSAFNFFSSGHWTYSFKYENGKMTEMNYNGGGNQNTIYTYDSVGRLQSASKSEPFTGDYHSISYEYKY